MVIFVNELHEVIPTLNLIFWPRHSSFLVRFQLHGGGVVRDHGVAVPSQHPPDVGVLDPLPDRVGCQGPAEAVASDLFVNPSINSDHKEIVGYGNRAPAKFNTSRWWQRLGSNQ